MQATRLITVLLAFFFLSATANWLEAQTITHVPLYTFDGDSAGDAFGFSVSGAGDVNGDGSADLIVGARFDNNNGIQSGSARVLSGSDGSVLYNFDGDGERDYFGESVSGVGDLNGDGFDDFIVGAPDFIGVNPTTSTGGTARVFSGIDGSVLYNFSGDSAGDALGASVSDAGDVNGDGTPDLIVGAIQSGNPGYARVLSGSDGTVLHNFTGDTPFDLFGDAVSGAGDVNGDGTPDLIVGAKDDDNNGSASGNVRVLSGSDGGVLYTLDGGEQFDFFGRTVSGVGDVNGDGFDDFIVGAANERNSSRGSASVFSGIDGRVLYNFEGDGPSDFFSSSISGAGDVNGDGTPDLIVGASGDNNNGPNSGSTRVFSGIDGSVLYNFDGDSERDRFGSSVSDVGDVNGDGIDDFIVGAFAGGANGGGYARVFVSKIFLLGDSDQNGVVNMLDISPFILILSAGDYLVEADINQDGVVNFLDISLFIAILSL